GSERRTRGPSVGPEDREGEGDRVEGGHARLLGVLQGGDEGPGPLAEGEGLEGAADRIDEPGERDAGGGVEAALVGHVGAAGDGAKNLADPVGRQVEPCDGWIFRHPLASPAGEVGNKDVRSEVEFGFVEDPPAAGSLGAAVEWATDADAQRGARAGVRG